MKRNSTTARRQPYRTDTFAPDQLVDTRPRNRAMRRHLADRHERVEPAGFPSTGFHLLLLGLNLRDRTGGRIDDVVAVLILLLLCDDRLVISRISYAN